MQTNDCNPRRNSPAFLGSRICMPAPKHGRHLLVDRAKQAFKLREDAHPHQTTCDQGRAKTAFGYRLRQTSFNFDVFVEAVGPQQRANRPVGFKPILLGTAATNAASLIFFGS